MRVQTPKICLAAVKQNSLALKYVDEQTPEICLAAVQQDADALIYVKGQFMYLFEDKNKPKFRF